MKSGPFLSIPNFIYLYISLFFKGFQLFRMTFATILPILYSAALNTLCCKSFFKLYLLKEFNSIFQAVIGHMNISVHRCL